jgi:hypothetical protein
MPALSQGKFGKHLFQRPQRWHVGILGQGRLRDSDPDAFDNIPDAAFDELAPTDYGVCEKLSLEGTETP